MVPSEVCFVSQNANEPHCVALLLEPVMGKSLETLKGNLVAMTARVELGGTWEAPAGWARGKLCWAQERKRAQVCLAVANESHPRTCRKTAAPQLDLVAWWWQGSGQGLWVCLSAHLQQSRVRPRGTGFSRVVSRTTVPQTTCVLEVSPEV